MKHKHKNCSMCYKKCLHLQYGGPYCSNHEFQEIQREVPNVYNKIDEDKVEIPDEKGRILKNIIEFIQLWKSREIR